MALCVTNKIKYPSVFDQLPGDQYCNMAISASTKYEQN